MDKGNCRNGSESKPQFYEIKTVIGKSSAVIDGISIDPCLLPISKLRSNNSKVNFGLEMLNLYPFYAFVKLVRTLNIVGMAIITFILSFLLNSTSPPALKVNVYQLKEQPAVTKRKLIVFSGSDWCKNCIRFKKEVLSSGVFQEFAKDHIEIVTADFPQKKQLSLQEVTKNEALAEKYNRQGEFPRLVLLSADGLKSQVIEYKSQSPELFVAELKSLIAGE